MPAGSIIRLYSPTLILEGLNIKMSDKEKLILTSIGIFCLILIIISFTADGIPGPDPWLIEWTSWIGTVVGMVIAARVFWTGANGLRNLVETGRWYSEKTSKTE